MKKIFTPFLLLLIINVASAQSLSPTVIASSGNYHEGTSVILSYTIGEPVVTTIGNSSGILTQGFQQPSEKADGVQQVDLNNLNISIYPNPANETVNIFINSKENAPDISVKITDILGRELRLPTTIYSDGNQQSFSINLSNLSAAMYFITIRDNKNNTSSTSKINKINF